MAGFSPSTSGENSERSPGSDAGLIAEAEKVKMKRRGRPPANWWPDFAEELAVYLHDMGLPQGSGTDGQTEVIDAVFARMVAAGKEEASRASVQNVVNAVLLRIRSAEK